jgi:hypothetical protein
MSRAQLTSTVEQNTGGAVAPFVAGKNKIINGDFGIWQRGISFVNPNFSDYLADRFRMINYDTKPTSATISQQPFTTGTCPAGYESAFFFRSTITTVGTTTQYDFGQYIEDVRTFAGQTATVSFWAKSDSTRTQQLFVGRNIGAGGSNPGTVTGGGNFTTTNAWQRFTFVTTWSPLTGATIGTNSNIYAFIRQACASGSVLDLWGFQIEAGSVATPFTTATGTFQGELAACQRYYWSLSGNIQQSASVSGNSVVTNFAFPVQMRTTPTVITNMTGSNYFTTASPWLWVQLGIAPCSLSTGTVTVLTIATNQQVALCTNTGTFNPTPNGFQINGTSFYLNASAEL